MSSYLTIKLIHKVKGKKEYLILDSWSRCSTIYAEFADSIDPVYCGSGKEENYTELNYDNLSEVIEKINEDIKYYKDYLKKYRKSVKIIEHYKTLMLNSKNIDEANNVFSQLKEYLDADENLINVNEINQELSDLCQAKTIVYGLIDIVDNLSFSSFSGMVCNVD